MISQRHERALAERGTHLESSYPGRVSPKGQKEPTKERGREPTRTEGSPPGRRTVSIWHGGTKALPFVAFTTQIMVGSTLISYFALL